MKTHKSVILWRLPGTQAVEELRAPLGAFPRRTSPLFSRVPFNFRAALQLKKRSEEVKLLSRLLTTKCNVVLRFSHFLHGLIHRIKKHIVSRLSHKPSLEGEKQPAYQAFKGKGEEASFPSHSLLNACHAGQKKKRSATIKIRRVWGTEGARAQSRRTYISNKCLCSHQLLYFYIIPQNTPCQIQRTGDPAFQTSCLSGKKRREKYLISTIRRIKILLNHVQMYSYYAGSFLFLSSQKRYPNLNHYFCCLHGYLLVITLELTED